MTNLQEDFLNMSQTTISVLNTNAMVWNGNAPTVVLVKLIEDTNNEVVDLLAEQQKDYGGITKGKLADRTGVEDDTHTVTNILSFFAADTGSTIPGTEKTNPSDLAHVSGQRLIGIAQVVLKAGTANLTAAAPYGLTKEMLDSLTKHIDAFTASINAPRVAITGTANATGMIEQKIRTLHELIEKKLDAAMVLFKSNTEFYNQYKIARIIVHSATRHIAATAHFTEGSSAVADAKVTITGTDDNKKKVLRKSSLLGNIRVQNLVPGDYVMMVEKPGLQTQEIKFTVAPPETTKLEVVMQ